MLEVNVGYKYKKYYHFSSHRWFSGVVFGRIPGTPLFGISLIVGTHNLLKITPIRNTDITMLSSLTINKITFQPLFIK